MTVYYHKVLTLRKKWFWEDKAARGCYVGYWIILISVGAIALAEAAPYFYLNTQLQNDFDETKAVVTRIERNSSTTLCLLLYSSNSEQNWEWFLAAILDRFVATEEGNNWLFHYK